MCKTPLLKNTLRFGAAAFAILGLTACVTTEPAVPLQGKVVSKKKRDLPIAADEKGSILVVFRGKEMPSTKWANESSGKEKFDVIAAPASHEEAAITNFATGSHTLYFWSTKKNVVVPKAEKIKVYTSKTTVVEVEYKEKW